MIKQLANTLRYLRDAGITYHNLQQKNIGIKKNLIVNIIDFTNSDH